MATLTAGQPRTLDGDAAEPGSPRPRLVSPVASVALADLDASRSIRLAVDRTHLAVIVGLEGRWPPILVDRATRRIVDGHYRYLAAERSGWTHIDCEYFHGTADDAFLEAVRRNSGHGLPLTLAERRRVARRLLELYGEWSDRRIAQTVGLSASTVAVARRASAGGPMSASGPRLGRDGRLRTPDHRLVRQRVRSALKAMPHGSLRQIASIARSSPETVRSVRNERPASMVPVPAPTLRATHAPPRPPPDSALSAMPRGMEFTAWFQRSRIDADALNFTGDIPLSRVYEVADEARRRASMWVTFADSLEARTRGRMR